MPIDLVHISSPLSSSAAEMTVCLFDCVIHGSEGGSSDKKSAFFEIERNNRGASSHDQIKL